MVSVPWLRSRTLYQIFAQDGASVTATTAASPWRIGHTPLPCVTISHVRVPELLLQPRFAHLNGHEGETPVLVP